MNFEAPTGVEARVWRRFKAEWVDSAVLEVRIGDFDIPLEVFLAKVSRLRFAWTNLGTPYRVDLSQELRELIKTAHDVERELTNRISNTIKPSPIALQGLGLRRELTAFQQRDLGCLAEMRAGANFSVPGAGKTTVTLVLWRLLQVRGNVGKLLVVAPRSAFEAWSTEPFEVFESCGDTEIFEGESPREAAQILVTNYEQLESTKKLKRIEHWVEANNAMLVLDEAHRVKGGSRSVRWRACSSLAPLASRVDLLTGTPMPQGYQDLVNLFSLSWHRVPSTFFTDSKLQSLSPGSLFVRTTKDELNLPPLHSKLVSLPMGDYQAQIYSALKKAYVGQFSLSGSQASFFGAKGKAVMTLLAAATNPSLMMGLRDEHDFKGLCWPPRKANLDSTLLEVVEAYSEMPPKYEWVARYCGVAHREGRKVLVWSNFVGNLSALKRVLKPLNPALIYGQTSTEERVSELRRFRSDSDCNVLLTNPQTLGEGVSLHHQCHECIFVDRIYNAGLYLQALDRIHRLGLPKDQVTQVFVLQSTHSIDQRVEIRLEQKIRTMADALKDSGLVKSSVPDLCDMTPDELVGLDSLDCEDLFEHLKTDD